MIFRDNDFQDMDSGIMYIRDFELRDFVPDPIQHYISEILKHILKHYLTIIISKKRNLVKLNFL